MPNGTTMLKFARCSRSDNAAAKCERMVTGEWPEAKERYFYCTSERMAVDSVSCGPEARFFEPKSENQP